LRLLRPQMARSVAFAKRNDGDRWCRARYGLPAGTGNLNEKCIHFKGWSETAYANVSAMPPRLSPAFRSGCLLATIVVTGIILLQSMQERGQPGVPDLTSNEAYLAHFAIYAVMTFLALTALAPRTVFGFAVVIIAAIGLGVAMELYQAQTATRSGSAADVLADGAGVLFGAFTYITVTILMEPSRTRQPTKS
jgi:VanZ family protein